MTHTLTIKEIAAKTGRSVRHLQRLAAAGDLPSVLSPNGYHRTYPLTDRLRRWIAEEAGMQRGRRIASPRLKGETTLSVAVQRRLMYARRFAEDVWEKSWRLGYDLPGAKEVRQLAELLEKFEKRPKRERPSTKRVFKFLDD
jgi:hypothetical protein